MNYVREMKQRSRSYLIIKCNTLYTKYLTYDAMTAQ